MVAVSRQRTFSASDLVPVLDDHAVARDDQPPPGSHLRYPVRVEHVRAGDGARRSLPLVDDSPRIAGIGHVVTEAGEDLAEPEHVSVDVDADLSRTQVHADARCDSS
jgi:hypothetical protein